MKKNRIALAGIGRDADGALIGYHLEWIAFESRDFSDLLADWLTIDLTGVLSQDDLIELISGRKRPSREVVNYLCAEVPSDLCSWLVLRNRGYRAARTASEQVSVSEASLAAAIQLRLESMARETGEANAGEANAHSADIFLEFVAERVDEIANRLSRAANPAKSMANLAAVLGLSVEEFKGLSRMEDTAIATKSAELGSMLQLEGDDFDQCLELAELAWTGVNAGRRAQAFPRIMKYLRRTRGLTQMDCAAIFGSKGWLISRIEQASSMPSQDFLGEVSARFNLAAEGTAIIERTAREYSEFLRADFVRHFAPVVAHFQNDGLTAEAMLQAAIKDPWLSYKKPETVIANTEEMVEYGPFKEAGLTRKNYLQAATKYPQLFWQKPETLIGNIERVYHRFADDGLLLEDYLQAAIRQPQLFSQKPQTLIGHINRIIAMFRRGTLSFKRTSSHPDNDKPLKPLFDFLTRSPSLICLGDDNLTVREIYAAVTDAPPSRAILKTPREKVEQSLFERFGHSDRTRPVPPVPYDPLDLSIEEGSSEERQLGDILMLRILIRGGVLKGALEEPKAQREWRRGV